MYIHKLLYNIAHYNTVLDITCIHDGSQKDYIEKMTINYHFCVACVAWQTYRDHVVCLQREGCHHAFRF